jgi:hypothetical protein
MGNIEFAASFSVCQPKHQAAFPIPVSEWERLKSRIKRICPERKCYQVLSSLFFGVFASAIVALVPLSNTKASLNPWVLPTTWVVLVGSGVLGIALAVIDAQQKKVISESTTSVIEEMESLESQYQTEDVQS